MLHKSEGNPNETVSTNETALFTLFERPIEEMSLFSVNNYKHCWCSSVKRRD